MRALSLTVTAVTTTLVAASIGVPALAADAPDPGLGSAPSSSAPPSSAPAGGEDDSTPSPDPTSAPSSAPASAPDASSPDSSTGSTAGGGTAVDTYSAAVSDVERIALDPAEVTILGARWNGEDPELEFRSETNGAWTGWEDLPAADDPGPDESSPEAAQSTDAAGESEAVPVLDATAVEVRASAAGAATTDLTITTAATPVTDADESLAKRPDPGTPSGLSPQKYNEGLKANIITRAEWGADESLVRCQSDQTSSAKGVFVHHTAGSNSYSEAEAPGIIRGYLAYHTQSRGWCDIGYNFLVDRFGNIYEGRAGSIDKAITGAHASGFNSSTIGVSVLGTYTGSAPSSAAQKAVERVIAWKANTYGFSPTGSMTLTSGGGGTSKYPAGQKVTLKTVSGHRDTSYTDCPGGAFYSRLGAMRTNAAALQDDLGYSVGGAIGSYYRANKAATGEPTGPERSLSNPDGAYQFFQKGVVYWSKSTGAHLNKGGIRSAYAALKYEKGLLGFPTTDEVTFRYRSDAVYQGFEHGIITYSAATKGQPLSYGMLSKWKELGWERSRLGLPTTGEFSSGGKTRQNFEGGYMTFTASEGVRVFYSN